MVELTHSLAPVLPVLLGRLPALFDLDARPDLLATHLGNGAQLRTAVEGNPGLRVPGAFDGFELGVRAILGQRVTVKAATTIASRFVEAFGDPIVTPVAELNRLTPAPERIAAGSADDVLRRGILIARSRRIIALAAAYLSGKLSLDAGAHLHPDEAVARLTELRGIGPWTAHYIVMRALRWPDAFPKEDVAICHKLGGVTPNEAEAMSQAWRPWRSYAVMQLWNLPQRIPLDGNSLPHAEL
jgi:AraC family transcriptional regulator, regulatory protein of adaptative response / DNA-3-methyladenine glycosylase II